MKENIQWVSSPENISTSSLWIWVQNLTVDVLFSHVDHASADKCRCSSGDCGVCVVMVRFGRCCCWVHGVAAPRLNLPELQTQLLAEEGLQIPEGTSRFLKVAPHLDCCLLHAQSMAPPWDTDWVIATNIACCIFPYALVEKNPSPCERWIRNVDKSRVNSFWP